MKPKEKLECHLFWLNSQLNAYPQSRELQNKFKDEIIEYEQAIALLESPPRLQEVDKYIKIQQHKK